MCTHACQDDRRPHDPHTSPKKIPAPIIQQIDGTHVKVTSTVHTQNDSSNQCHTPPFQEVSPQTTAQTAPQTTTTPDNQRPPPRQQQIQKGQRVYPIGACCRLPRFPSTDGLLCWLPQRVLAAKKRSRKPNRRPTFTTRVPASKDHVFHPGAGLKICWKNLQAVT